MTTNLEDVDFPLIARGQFIYARRFSSPIIDPVTMELAEDLAARLNRDFRQKQRDQGLSK